MSLSAQEYKWVSVNSQGSLMKCWGQTLRWTDIPSRGGSSNPPCHFMLWKLGQALAEWATWHKYRLNHNHHFYHLGNSQHSINITFPASQCKWDIIFTSRGDINFSIAIKNQLGHWIVTLPVEKCRMHIQMFSSHWWRPIEFC